LLNHQLILGFFFGECRENTIIPHHPYLGVSENRGFSPKMDGLQWKTLIKWDDLGGKPTIFGNIHFFSHTSLVSSISQQTSFSKPKKREAEGSCGKREGDNG